MPIWYARRGQVGKRTFIRRVCLRVRRVTSSIVRGQDHSAIKIDDSLLALTGPTDKINIDLNKHAMKMSLLLLMHLSTVAGALAWPDSVLLKRADNGSVFKITKMRDARPVERATADARILTNDNRKSAGVLRNVWAECDRSTVDHAGHCTNCRW